MSEKNRMTDAERQERYLARRSPAWRESTLGSIALTGSAYRASPVRRTPDADDICDALRLAARINEASDRRLSQLLEKAADEIARLWREHEALQQRLEARKEGHDDAR